MSKHSKHQQPRKSPALTNVQKFFPKVTRVTDATKPLEIVVTAQDDKVSRKLDHAGCAMAVACKREFKLDGAIVSRCVAYLVKGDEAVRYDVPERATREVISFDRGGGFNPGEYTLQKPEYGLGERHSGDMGEGVKSHSGNLHKRFHRYTANVRTPLGSKHA
jgi:hypothetical protein